MSHGIIYCTIMNTFVVTAFCFAFSLVYGSPANYYASAPESASITLPHQGQDYNFAYAVQDSASSNQQSREENKYGNTVSGRYTVLEPTGELRVVNYVADENGFRAQVQSQPQADGYNGYAAPAAIKLRAPYVTAHPHH